MQVAPQFFLGTLFRCKSKRKLAFLTFYPNLNFSLLFVGCPKFESSGVLHFWIFWTNLQIFVTFLPFYKCAQMSFLLSQTLQNNRQPSIEHPFPFPGFPGMILFPFPGNEIPHSREIWVLKSMKTGYFLVLNSEFFFYNFQQNESISNFV